MPTSNPGQELQSALERLYPFDPAKTIEMIDHDFMSDGEISQVARKSAVNYVLRRLITTAEHHRRKFPVDKFGEARYVVEFRKFLRDFTRYKPKDIEKIVEVISRCLLVSDHNISDGRRNQMKKSVREQNLKCYMCGGDMAATTADLEPESRDKTAMSNLLTADHVWPRSMGGLSEEINLRAACARCNTERQNTIDAYDAHYEEMSFLAVHYEDYEEKEKRRKFEIAVFAKTNFTCYLCKNPAARIGKLFVGRIEPSDSWHFMNLAAYCSIHRPLHDVE